MDVQKHGLLNLPAVLFQVIPDVTFWCLLEKEAKVVLDTPVSKDAIRRALKKTNFDLTKMNTAFLKRVTSCEFIACME